MRAVYHSCFPGKVVYNDENFACLYFDCSYTRYCSNQVDENCEIFEEMSW